MKVLYSIDEAAGRFSRPVAAAGNFDGVHLGHRAIIEQAVTHARDDGGDCVIVTFEPHPQLVIGRHAAFSTIMTLDDRLRLFEQFPVTAALVLPFTPEFARTAPSEYIRNVYVDCLGIRAVVVGSSHTFGRFGAGDAGLLKTFGKRFGFDVYVVPPRTAPACRASPGAGGSHAEGAETVVDSSRIRTSIHAGRIRETARLLGHAYTLTGRVVHGAGRGRRLRFPTANLERASPHLLLPKLGVYAVRALIDGAWLPGVMNIGVRPTFGEEQSACEVHILDFQDELYDRELRVEVVDRIRDERRFESVEALQAQIAVDVEQARRMLDAHV